MVLSFSSDVDTLTLLAAEAKAVLFLEKGLFWIRDSSGKGTLLEKGFACRIQVRRTVRIIMYHGSRG
jgi:hypothetical protein